MDIIFRRQVWVAVICCTAMMFSNCSDPSEQDTTPPNKNTPGQVKQEEADAFMDQLKFANSLKVTGTVPSSVKASLVKTDSKDTIYTLAGLKMPLRISHPASMELTGIFIGAENASYYYDVPVLEEEESDTVSVVVLEIADDGEIASDMPIQVIPHDANKSPVDILTRVIRVEQPSTGCDLLIDGDTSNLEVINWIWHSTTVLDENETPIFINSPSRVDTAYQRPLGCCGTPPACPELKQDKSTGTFSWVYDSYVEATTYYSIGFEGFSFYRNGTFVRITIEEIKNFNPATTDWCKKVPGYNQRQTIVDYFGTHNYKPGNTSIMYVADRKKCDDPLGLCGYGSRPGALTQSCHLLIITPSTGAGDGPRRKEVRIYVKRQHIDKYNRRVFYT